jgi:hypothetical protein
MWCPSRWLWQRACAVRSSIAEPNRPKLANRTSMLAKDGRRRQPYRLVVGARLPREPHLALLRPAFHFYFLGSGPIKLARVCEV